MRDQTSPRFFFAAVGLAVALALASPAFGLGHGGHGGHGGGGRAFGSPAMTSGATLPGNDAVMQIEGELADARNRTIELTAWIVGLGILQTAIFGLALIAAARAVKRAGAAARALPLLERAYLFLAPDVSLASADHRGPRGGLNVSFDFGLKNHGRTPGFILWLNIAHHYLAEPPEAVYEDHGSGEGLVIGAGEVLRFDHHEMIMPGADWDKAQAGEGAIYLHGRLVYLDIFKARHETWFCWRHDPVRRAFAIVENAALNHFD